MSRAPETLDGYTLIRELGRGGMGVVYEVHDPRLDRRLALKLVLGREADPEALLRFQRESELLARINHPNVLRIHRVGTSQSGPYFVSELVEGEPLDQLTKRSGALPPEHAARLIRDLASATAALHTAGVIHRDLKPGNVVLRPDGSPVLIDFGLASDPRAQRLTVTGTILGTPHYMSPEQALGEASIGPPSDVYALGSMLFALLAGSAPNEGLTALMVLDAIVRGDTSWPPEVRERTPDSLTAICQRARAKEPQARPSAAQLALDLSGYLEDPSEGVRQRRLAPWLALAGGLFLLAGLAAWANTSGREAPAPSLAGPAASSSSPAPEVTSTPLDIAGAIVDLKRPTSESFARAEAILEEGHGERLERLRARYVGARLLAPPTSSFRSPSLPAHGKVAWFDARRLVVASETEPGLWSWNDWSRAEHSLSSSPGDKQTRRAGPLVFEDKVYLGGGHDRTTQIEVYAWETSPAQKTFPTQAAVSCLAAGRGPSGEAILAVGTFSAVSEIEGTILIFDLETGELSQTLRGHRPGIAGITVKETRAGAPGIGALTFSPDGRWLISGGLAGAVIVWDVATWKVTATRILNSGDVRSLACHPQRPLLAVSPGLGQGVRLVQLPSLKKTPVRPAFSSGDPTGACFSPDGRFLFAASNGASDSASARDIRAGELIAYDLERSQLVQTRRFGRQAPRSTQLSPDGRRLAVYSHGPGSEGILQVWEIDVPPLR